MKILLYSGGMDSWLIDKLWHPDQKVYINMGSKYSDAELRRILRIQERVDEVKVLDFPWLGRFEREDKIIPLRNLFLPMVVAMHYQDTDLEICIGATAGDRVLDKSVEYARKASDILSFLWQEQWWTPERRLDVVVPYKTMTKSDLLKEYVRQGGSLDTAFRGSFSCYEPTDKGECWQCKPCFRKFCSFAAEGYEFPETVLRKVIPYIEQEIKPQIINGTYGRGFEEENLILDVLERYHDFT